jgi:hypothetical protein
LSNKKYINKGLIRIILIRTKTNLQFNSNNNNLEENLKIYIQMKFIRIKRWINSKNKKKEKIHLGKIKIFMNLIKKKDKKILL